jgi:hypothetical protein
MKKRKQTANNLKDQEEKRERLEMQFDTLQQEVNPKGNNIKDFKNYAMEIRDKAQKFKKLRSVAESF